MENMKVLFICQEITPYLPESEISTICRTLPQGIQEKSREIRTFMPRYGCVNERRNQLHEVIRLSGMNLIIDDTDHPLIIKVASIQAAKMQVYFIDNEDYFQRKAILRNENGEHFADNDERAIFFARGVLETVRKLRWSPDLVHCHGWLTSLIPLYLKKSFNEDPLFMNSKIIYSIYNDQFGNTFDSKFKQKAKMEGIGDKDLSIVKTPGYSDITKLAIQYSDAVIQGSESIEPGVLEFSKTNGKPFLEYQDPENYIDVYSDFYDKILSEVNV
ncbi:MAG: glycogen/starch synthase [bacterium]